MLNSKIISANGADSTVKLVAKNGLSQRDSHLYYGGCLRGCKIVDKLSDWALRHKNMTK